MGEKALVKVGVIGARGFSGLELSRLLLKHPLVQFTACAATGDFCLEDYLGDYRARLVAVRPQEDLLKMAKAGEMDVVFLATPADVSMTLAPKFLEAGSHVIDLSGAFRLNKGSHEHREHTYKKWYHMNHSSAGLLDQAEFGLVPWNVTAKPHSGPRLIANPGCFATATLMAVLPILKAELIKPETLVIDAKSGTTGAGRKPEERLLHSMVDGLCLPYRIGSHQHEPEIAEAAEKFAGVKVEPFFTTHLLNVRRGIVASIYARVSDRFKGEEPNVIQTRFEHAFNVAYGDYPLCDVRSLEESGADVMLNLRRVVGTARTQISYRLVGDKLYMFSLLDNLLKGAASQAVENFNLLYDQPLDKGLDQLEAVI